MAIRHIVKAFETTGLNPSTKLVLLKLADNANDDGICWPSKSHIMAHTGLSRATVRRCIQRLADAGLLSVRHRMIDGEPTTNLYQLHLGGGFTVNPPGITVRPGVGSPRDPEASVLTVSESKTLCDKSHDARFNDFWDAWPKERRRNKKKAREAWKRKRLDKRADEIIADVIARRDNDGQWVRGYIPLPTTYLNGERWEDTMETIDTSSDQKQSAAALWDKIVSVAARANTNERSAFYNSCDDKTRKAITDIGGMKEIGLMQPFHLREARSRFVETYMAGGE